MSQTHGFLYIFDTLDDDHLRKMKKSSPQNITNIDFKLFCVNSCISISLSRLHNPPRKSVDFAGRTEDDARTDEHQISEASYTKSPFEEKLLEKNTLRFL